MQPMLGRAVRHEWMLDPEWVSVNHGSFGATPRVVLAVQEEWRKRMESQPGRFFIRELPDALRQAAERLGQFLGASGDDIAFVENATVGCNAVLRSLRLEPGDEILILDHGYRAVCNAVRYVAARAGAGVIEVRMPFPRPKEDAVVAAIESGLTSRTKLVVVDHITSPSAMILPIRMIIAACHDRAVPVLVDGAHGPGQVTLDLTQLGADYYVGNCHKWLCAPKGCGFLWAARDRQMDLHPVTISHGLGKGFLPEFDWTGTRDVTACLAVGAALDFFERLGGKQLMARNAELAARATALVCQRLNTEPGAEGKMAGAMGLVRLPSSGEATAERALAIRQRLLDERTDAPVHALGGSAWLRISAHAYNELADYERLAEIVARMTRDER